MASVSRRSLLIGAVAMTAEAEQLNPVVRALDHLLLGVNDLDRGIAWVEQRIGVKAVIGGSHPGVGTRNALLSLGSSHYLEIIAPDPAQSAYNSHIDVRPFTEPRLVNFAASSADLDAVAAAARKAGHGVFGPNNGARKLPSGETLRWRTLAVVTKLASGGIEPVPFFINWEPGTPHPSTTSPKGCEIESLAFQHPDPSALSSALETLGLKATVSKSERARIVARLKTPKGIVELS